MSAKRKDRRGRVLRTGENQRKNLSYEYRYKDINGERKSVYAKSLEELRELEKQIEQILSTGIDYSKGKIPLADFLENRISRKRNIKEGTLYQYSKNLKAIKKLPISNIPISDLKPIQLKDCFIDMYDQGYKYNSINVLYALLKQFLQVACDEEIIPKNPINFKLSDLIKKDSAETNSLSQEQLRNYLEFIKHDKTYSKYYNFCKALSLTGMRAGEMIGLTVHNVRFSEKKIVVDHQLTEYGNQKRIASTKSKSGVREIPMYGELFELFKTIVEEYNNRKVHTIIDGTSGFLFENNKTGKIVNHVRYNLSIARSVTKYNKKNPDNPLPHISCHVFRHTFCTNALNSGVDIKTVQYLLGHSSSSMTMHYAHFSREQIESQMKKLLNYSDIKQQQQTSQMPV